MGVQHAVSNSVILVPVEVIPEIHSTHVEAFITVLIVTSFFMGIDSPIEIVENLVFKSNDTYSLRIEIERHVVVSLYLHERRPSS